MAETYGIDETISKVFRGAHKLYQFDKDISDSAFEKFDTNRKFDLQKFLAETQARLSNYRLFQERQQDSWKRGFRNAMLGL